MPRGSARSTSAQLERGLVLLGWLNSQFGYTTNAELLYDTRRVPEGFGPDGLSYVYHHMVGRGDQVRVPREALARYDTNLCRHLDALNEHRSVPISLRYFQYLALLYTEVFLDWRFTRPGDLVRALNAFVHQHNVTKRASAPPPTEFTKTDLDKLAYWIATGGGKTLLMHVNCRQFLAYNEAPLDNILLVTPNEGLTAQHIAEMAASGINSEPFNLEESGLRLADPDTVRVIEITKLVEEKRGGGVSVPVEAFEGNNLIFVDEGHKGSGGQVWRKYRDDLGQTGFTFEYSATFGQALAAAGSSELTEEYGKAIVFDYSYRYFHGDGFGKDFRIVNLREEVSSEHTEILILANLLSFYEQLRYYAEHAEVLRPYLLERPLWVFVGSSVNAVYTRKRQRRSDVLTVVGFLHHFLTNRQNWAVATIRQVLEGRTGLVDPHGRDLFADRFVYLRQASLQAESAYRDILSRVFGASASGALHLCDIRGVPGELGLRVGTAQDYFGVIYIGDTAAFKKLVIEDDAGVVVEDDVIAESLFGPINDPETSINVLVGAKKFMEGWNSWRVSNMGLLNVGRSAGSEIIQLFGRGVRLRGTGYSLKRSSAILGEHPENISLLETLDIFAVRANYMAQFRDYLEREGVDTAGQVTLDLTIKPNRDLLQKGLVMPRWPPPERFANECVVVLQPDGAARVTVDVTPRIEALQSTAEGVTSEWASSGGEQRISADALDMLDWERLYLELQEFKRERGHYNLVIRPDAPRQILDSVEPRLYRLIAQPEVVSPPTLAATGRLHDAVLAILCKYVAKYYRVCQSRYDSNNLDYGPLTIRDPNFRDYVVRLPASDESFVESVKGLIREARAIYEADTQDLPTIHFDRHLYEPLLVAAEGVDSDPPGLEPSEERFVLDMREYCTREADGALAGKELFLLRNLGRGRGHGFFEREGFYPDFILWIKDRDGQRVVFVEPHGMVHEKTYWDSDKTQLHLRLAELSEKLRRDRELEGVTLDSYIISATPYEGLAPYYHDGSWTLQDFAERHILFFDTGPGLNYIASLLQVQ